MANALSASNRQWQQLAVAFIAAAALAAAAFDDLIFHPDCRQILRQLDALDVAIIEMHHVIAGNISYIIGMS